MRVYTGLPDLSISASAKSLDVSYDHASAALALQVESVSGLSGPVTLSCTGLPAGLSCQFDSASPTLGADGTLTANVVIVPSTAAGIATFGLLLLPTIGAGVKRKASRRKLRMAAGITLIAVSFLAGCGGGNDSTPARETGTKTVLVTATVGGVTRNVAVDVNIR